MSSAVTSSSGVWTTNCCAKLTSVLTPPNSSTIWFTAAVHAAASGPSHSRTRPAAWREYVEKRYHGYLRPAEGGAKLAAIDATLREDLVRAGASVGAE